MESQKQLIVIGGGLAGSEAAWQAAQLGIKVDLYEMRPHVATGAHTSADLAELVCSNSLGSTLPDRASGIMKNELRQLHSLVLEVAEETALPAGYALAVDREQFARKVTRRVETHPNIRVIRQEMTKIPDEPCIIASGPLTSPPLAQSLMHLTGSDNLYFYDAIAPIVEFTSIDMNIAFRASRFNRNEDDEGDYINCALNKNEYDLFVHELAVAERISLQDFESEITSGVKAGHHAYFEGCLPIEVMAQRHPQSLAFGPLRPIGLRDPRTGQRPHAVVQLRQDNLAATLYNMVGFQTNLTFSEQQRVFRLIPGLEHATFARYGQMHRNTYLAAPLFLSPTLQFNSHPNLWVAGQLSGVEGYMGNIATGLLAGLNAGRFLKGQPQMVLPPETMTGALCYYISHADPKSFQPMKANLGILPALPEFIRDKRTKALMLAERANLSLQDYLAQFHA